VHIRLQELGIGFVCLKENKLPTKPFMIMRMSCIIYNKHDFIFAEEQAEKVNSNAILFLQPEWSKKEEMTL
jgi:hypothetical protein